LQLLPVEIQFADRCALCVHRDYCSTLRLVYLVRVLCVIELLSVYINELYYILSL